MENKTPYTVILVHGTWGTLSPFLDPATPFRDAILEALGKGSVVDDSFSWSGRNSPSARSHAAETLARHIKAIVDRSTDRIILIGHSHGGTVCTEALRDHDEVKEHVVGVCCLSTPFLYSQRRPEFFVHLMQLAFSAPGSTVCILLLLLAPYWMIPFILILLYFSNSVAESIFHALLARAEAQIEGLRSTITTRHLLVRTPGDEASAAIGAGSLASWALSRFAQKLADVLLWPVSKLDAISDALITVIRGKRHFGPSEFGMGVYRGSVETIFYHYFLPFAVYAIMLPLRLPIVALCGLIWVPVAFGLAMTSRMVGGYFSTGMLIEVHAEATPAGSWQITNVPTLFELLREIRMDSGRVLTVEEFIEKEAWDSQELDSQFDDRIEMYHTELVANMAMAHSRSYTHPAVLKLISSWLREL